MQEVQLRWTVSASQSDLDSMFALVFDASSPIQMHVHNAPNVAKQQLQTWGISAVHTLFKR